MASSLVHTARAALLAALLAGTVARSHQTPLGDVYPVVTPRDRGFVVTYRSSLENLFYSQAYGLDGRPSSEKRPVHESKVPTRARSVNSSRGLKGIPSDKVRAVHAAIFQGTSTGAVSDGTTAEWIRITKEDASLCRLWISTLEQRCVRLGKVLDGPMGLPLLAEPLERGAERAVFWISPEGGLMFSSWARYSEAPVQTQRVGGEWTWNTSLASAVSGDTALLAAHLPDTEGVFRIRTWTLQWPVGRGNPGGAPR